MARGGARTHVELVEDDDDGVPGAPSGARAEQATDAGSGPHVRTGTDAADPAEDDAPGIPATHRTRRRAVLAGAVVAVALVVAAVVGQAVTASQERARVAALAGVPGIVDAVDGPVRVVRSEADETLRRATARTDAGLVVSPRDGTDGREVVRAVDPATGALAWETELIPAGSAPSVPPGGEVVSSRTACRGFPGDRLVCLADDGVGLVGRGTLTQLPPDSTRLVVLDARDGSVVADLTGDMGDPAPVRSFDVLDDLVVVGLADAASVRLTALTAGGDVVWTAAFPSRTTTAYGMGVEVTSTPRGVVVVTPDAVRLLDAAGTTLQDVPLRTVDVVRGTLADAAVMDAGDGGTVLVRPGGEHRLTGSWVPLGVDDGSAPGLVLTWDDDGLHGAGTDGRERWSTDLRVDGREALLLAGQVMVGSGAALVALDAADGREVWRADGVLPSSGTATDGRHVFVLAPGEDAVPEVLLALDATDGDVVWRVPLSGPADWLLSIHGVLSVVTFGEQPDGPGPRVTVLR